MNFISNYAEKEFHKKDIHELRNIARSIGVSQPTSKKKETLIQDILSIMTGETMPEYRNINRGRPAKTSMEVEYSSPSYVLSFQAASNTSYNVAKVRTGVVVKTGDDFYIKKLKFVDSKDDFKLKISFVNKYNLKENDTVEYLLEDGNLSIISVNGTSTVQKKSKVVEGKKIILHDTNILKVDLLSKKKKIADSFDGDVLYIPCSSADVFESKTTTILPVCGLADNEVVNSFCATMSLATLYKKGGKEVTVVMSNFINLLSSIKGLNYVGLGEQVTEYLNRFIDCGGTFVGFVPTALEKIDFDAHNID